MTSPRRTILTLWIAGLVLAQPMSAVAQREYSQGTAKVQHQFSEAEMRDLAWRAYTAGVDHETGAIPLLRQIVEFPPAFPESERTALLDAAFDALIQMNAAVPASILRPYFDLRPVQTLLLLANTLDRDPVLLALLTKTTGLRWNAVANLLLQDRDPGLAVHLLSTLTLHLTIEVRDDDLDFGYSSGGGFWCGDSLGTNPPQYPPRAVYRMERSDGDGNTVLADGPRPVYYSRAMRTDSQYGFGECGISGPDDAERLRYLSAIHGLPDRPAPAAETSTFAQWSTPEALMEKIEQLHAAIERDYDFLIADLINSGAIAAEDAWKLPARVDIRLRDEREDKSIPLPSVPEVH